MNELTATARKQQDHDRKEAKVKIYRTRWNESEKILNVLRSQGAIQLREISDEELLKWAEKDAPTCTTIITLKDTTTRETG
jgi:hypothetical protein